jgi:predicted transposase YbfD/YdcC
VFTLALLLEGHGVTTDALSCLHKDELKITQEEDEENASDYFLQFTACAIRNIYHITLQASPSQLVFGIDMIHNIELKANWNRIQKRKQDLNNMSDNKENRDINKTCFLCLGHFNIQKPADQIGCTPFPAAQ